MYVCVAFAKSPEGQVERQLKHHVSYCPKNNRQNWTIKAHRKKYSIYDDQSRYQTETSGRVWTMNDQKNMD